MRRLLASFVTLFISALPLAAAPALPAAEDLIQRFIAQSGGEAAYAKIKSVEMSGTVEIEGRNITGKISVAEDGEKSSTIMDLAGLGRIEQGFDGDTAWELSALQGPRIIEGEEKSALRRGSNFSLVSAWRDDYKTLRTVGSEDVNGKPAWKVEMTPREGRPELFFFDRDSALLVRSSVIISTPLGDIPSDVLISDYRLLDGIRTPFAMTQSAMGQNILMRFEKVAFNVTLPKERFALPDPAKALLKK